MRPCLVGIGGAGGNVAKQFLKSQDADLPRIKLGEQLTFGDVKGLWLESAAQDAQDQSFYGNFAKGEQPGYLICHDSIRPDSVTRDYVMRNYGYDLKAQGYDRRAEYLKGVFEIFDFDKDLRKLASEEFQGDENPMPGYIWKAGIRPMTTVSISKSKGALKGNDTEVLGNNKRAALSALGGIIERRANNINPSSTKLCDSILFMASLGGGTGTGFINPITNFVRLEELAFPIFAFGILTEKGSDARHAREGQRDLGAVIAMYDLLTKEAGTGIDALIIVDNQTLLERFNGNYPAMDAAISHAMRPMLDRKNYPGSQLQDDAPAMRRVIWESEGGKTIEDLGQTKLLPPVLVPCYSTRRASEGGEISLVDKALSKGGRLFDCDPTKAERAFVFTRGYIKANDVKQEVHVKTGIPLKEIKVYGKIGDNITEDVLILLKNPYGGSTEAYKTDGTFEKRIYDIIIESTKYIEESSSDIIEYLGYGEHTKEFLSKYFYGDGMLLEELKNCLERLERGQKPIFIKPLRIFEEGWSLASTFEPSQREKVPSLSDSEIQALVRGELNRILGSEECVQKLKNILK